MKDAIAYMAWERVVPWKILSMAACPGARLAPCGFGARNRDFKACLEPGSQIWVVTRIAGEFSLAGRVTVGELLDRDRISRDRWPEELAGLLVQWKFVARADPARSEFFETNDAGPVLARHQVRFAQNQTISYHGAPLTGSFQACTDQASKTVFISYRWKEARRFAIALAREFRRQGLSPWLDALSIPAYKNKGDPEVNEQRLQKLLQLGIEQSKMSVAINTGTYAKQGWTRLELDHIRRQEAPWFQVMRGGAELECAEPPLYSRKPSQIVQEILSRDALHI